MFPSLKEEIISEPLEHMATPKTAIHFLGEQMRKYISTKNDMDAIWKDAYSYYNTNEMWQEQIVMLKRGLLAQETVEHISKKMIKKIVVLIVTISIVLAGCNKNDILTSIGKEIGVDISSEKILEEKDDHGVFFSFLKVRRS